MLLSAAPLHLDLTFKTSNQYLYGEKNEIYYIITRFPSCIIKLRIVIYGGYDYVVSVCFCEGQTKHWLNRDPLTLLLDAVTFEPDRARYCVLIPVQL